VRVLALAWNMKCRPPQPEADVLRTVESIERRHRAATAPEGASPADLLAVVSEAVGVEIVAARRIVGEQSILELTHANGRRASIALGFWPRWERAEGVLMELTGRVPRKPSGKSWRRRWRELADMTLRAAEQIDPGEEATDLGELRGWVTSYLLTAEPRADGEESLSANDPRLHDGKVHLSLKVLRSYVNMVCMTMVDQKALAQRLRAAGFEDVTLRVPLSRGATPQIRFWKVPEGFCDTSI